MLIDASWLKETSGPNKKMILEMIIGWKDIKLMVRLEGGIGRVWLIFIAESRDLKSEVWAKRSSFKWLELLFSKFNIGTSFLLINIICPKLGSKHWLETVLLDCPVVIHDMNIYVYLQQQYALLLVFIVNTKWMCFQNTSEVHNTKSNSYFYELAAAHDRVAWWRPSEEAKVRNGLYSHRWWYIAQLGLYFESIFFFCYCPE